MVLLILFVILFVNFIGAKNKYNNLIIATKESTRLNREIVVYDYKDKEKYTVFRNKAIDVTSICDDKFNKVTASLLLRTLTKKKINEAILTCNSSKNQLNKVSGSIIIPDQMKKSIKIILESSIRQIGYENQALYILKNIDNSNKVKSFIKFDKLLDKIQEESENSYREMIKIESNVD